MNKITFTEVDIENVVYSTEDAVLINLGEGRHEWIPRSVISQQDDDEIMPRERHVERQSIKIAESFAQIKGLI